MRIKQHTCKELTKAGHYKYSIYFQYLGLKMYPKARLMGYTYKYMVFTWIGNIFVLQEAIVVCNKIQKWANQRIFKEISYLLFFQRFPQSNFPDAISKEARKV